MLGLKAAWHVTVSWPWKGVGISPKSKGGLGRGVASGAVPASCPSLPAGGSPGIGPKSRGRDGTSRAIPAPCPSLPAGGTPPWPPWPAWSPPLPPPPGERPTGCPFGSASSCVSRW